MDSSLTATNKTGEGFKSLTGSPRFESPIQKGSPRAFATGYYSSQSKEEKKSLFSPRNRSRSLTDDKVTRRSAEDFGKPVEGNKARKKRPTSLFNLSIPSRSSYSDGKLTRRKTVPSLSIPIKDNSKRGQIAGVLASVGLLLDLVEDLTKHEVSTATDINTLSRGKSPANQYSAQVAYRVAIQTMAQSFLKVLRQHQGWPENYNVKKFPDNFKPLIQALTNDFFPNIKLDPLTIKVLKIRRDCVEEKKTFKGKGIKSANSLFWLQIFPKAVYNEVDKQSEAKAQEEQKVLLAILTVMNKLASQAESEVIKRSAEEFGKPLEKKKRPTSLFNLSIPSRSSYSDGKLARRKTVPSLSIPIKDNSKRDQIADVLASANLLPDLVEDLTKHEVSTVSTATDINTLFRGKSPASQYSAQVAYRVAIQAMARSFLKVLRQHQGWPENYNVKKFPDNFKPLIQALANNFFPNIKLDPLTIEVLKIRRDFVEKKFEDEGIKSANSLFWLRIFPKAVYSEVGKQSEAKALEEQKVLSAILTVMNKLASKAESEDPVIKECCEILRPRFKKFQDLYE